MVIYKENHSQYILCNKANSDKSFGKFSSLGISFFLSKSVERLLRFH